MKLKDGKHSIRKAHKIGASTVVTIDPAIVNLLKIDDMTFFSQKPIENGITMEMLKLRSEVNEQK